MTLRFESIGSARDDLVVLHSVYEELLRPAFPPSELADFESFAAGIGDGASGGVLVALDGGRLAGVAVDSWSSSARIGLLGYLAVAGDRRDRGVGSALLTELRRRWADAPIDVVLGEVEDPRVHADTPENRTGARLRFYERLGADVFDAPWTQPGLDGGPRVPGFVLVRVWSRPGASPLDADVLGRWAESYYADEEGRRPDDDGFRVLHARITAVSPVPFVPLGELGRRGSELEAT